jgi:hypothetical protein
VFRQVSWLAGLNPSSPSQALQRKAQWQIEEGLAADSCGNERGSFSWLFVILVLDSRPPRRASKKAERVIDRGRAGAVDAGVE